MIRTALTAGLAALALSLAAAAPAAAGPAEAAACAAALSPEGKLMYDAVAPHVRPDSDLRALMRTHVRPLVMKGQISRSAAQANGQAVGQCLYLLK